MAQVKGFQVTEGTLPIVKYYHQHRLLKHTHHHHPRHHHQQNQQSEEVDDDDDDDDDDRKGVSNNKTNHKGRAVSPARGGKNKEKFYYTPHLTDQVYTNATRLLLIQPNLTLT